MTTLKTKDPDLNFYLEWKAAERERMRERLRVKHPGWSEDKIEDEICEIVFHGDDLGY